MSEAKTREEIKLYELGFHIISSVPQDKVAGEFELIKKTITDNGGEIVKEIEAKLINLAYEMTKKIADKNYKFNQTYFGSIFFNAGSEEVESIKKIIEANNKILRFLLIKTVDDFEHSTNKIERTAEEMKDAEATLNEESEEIDLSEGGDVVDTIEPIKTDEAEKTVDEAIDDLVK